MKCNPQTVIDVAESQIGYHEKASNSQLDDFTANSGSNNWNKYARDIDEKYPDFYNGKKNGYDWCDIFVDWCFITAYGRSEAQKLLCQPNHSLGAACPYSYGYFKDKGQVGTSPKKGAQIFFGDLEHTGIVVDFDNSYVYTVEGNTGSGEVCKKKYSRNSSWIYGYGYPAYDEVTPSPSPTPSGNAWTGGFPSLPSRGYYQKGDGYSTYVNKKPDIKLIQEFLNWAIGSNLVIDGEYGDKTFDAVKKFQNKVGIYCDGLYGKDTKAAAQTFRKDQPTPQPTPSQNEVKASQAAESYNANLAGTYYVDSAIGLNVRDGAGTQYKVLVVIPNGKRVECYGYYTGSWLYIAFEQSGTKYIGFASKDWLRR